MRTEESTALDLIADPLIGSVIGERYRIEAWIGEGQMARVYRARHVRLSSRAFAVKVLHCRRASQSLMRLRFAQEAEAASCLAHPNVVSVVDFGRSEAGDLYLVMDLVEGESLSRLIEREAPLPPPRAIGLARALARGLGHAHTRGLVHRDFKPDNVVLEQAGAAEPVPRVLDFGLAISADPEEEESGPRLTEEGFVVGTPIYLAPEQAVGEEIDQRADLYALGVVLYEMLAGRPPFDGDVLEVTRRKLVEVPPPIARRNPAAVVSPELEAVVRRLLENRPADRFQSARELIEALDRIETTLSAPAPVPVVIPMAEKLAPPPAAKASSPRRRRIAAAALGVLVAGAALSIIRAIDAHPVAAAVPPPRSPQEVVVAFVPPPPIAVSLEPAAAPAPAARAPRAPAPTAARPRPAPAVDPKDLDVLAREYREVGEAIAHMRAERGAAAGPLERRYLRLPYADSLRVPSLRRETLSALAELKQELRAAE